MKKTINILWAGVLAGALLLAAGCEKRELRSNEIRFRAATTPASQTKTAYSGDLDSSTPAVERINWSAGDQIRIYSDIAVCNNDAGYHYADYSLSDITDDGVISKAGTLTVSHSSRGGLAWTGSQSDYQFYGIYPSPGVSVEESTPGTVKGSSASPFTLSIPAAQAGTAASVALNLLPQTGITAAGAVYYPSMANAFLLAHDTTSDGEDITLEFEPAYTAFHIHAGVKATETAKVLSSVTLSSASTALTGSYTAWYSGGWNYGCPAYSVASGSENNAVTFTFGTGDYTIDPGESVEFVIFALPQALTDLTISFKLSDSQTPPSYTYRTLQLKYAGGAYLSFDACSKHYISGLLIPGSIWTVDGSTEIEMSASVQPWTPEDHDTVIYGEAPIINATKIDGNNPYSFSVYAPVSSAGAGKKWNWKVTVMNESLSDVVTDGVVLTQLNVAATNTSVNGVLQGEQPSDASNIQPVQFEVSGTPGTYYLSFSVFDSDGNEYCINSEVARNDAGYPIML